MGYCYKTQPERPSAGKSVDLFRRCVLCLVFASVVSVCVCVCVIVWALVWNLSRYVMHCLRCYATLLDHVVALFAGGEYV